MRSVAWLGLIVLSVTAVPPALAGPNAGGVLVAHSTTLAYTSGTSTYIGQSGVACGQDGGGTFPPCPPYDPTDGALPCDVTAANPTSAAPAGTRQVWYVLAAFAENTCPRLKAVAFGIEYRNVVLLDAGYDTANCFTLEEGNPGVPEGSWPESGSQTAWNWTGDSQNPCVTSHLWELYWFGGYAYAGDGGARFEVRPHSGPYNRFFVDDATPPTLDRIEGYGTLGFLGTFGSNPEPIDTWACCLADLCVIMTAFGCVEICGTPNGNYYCNPSGFDCWMPHKQSGACCGPDGVCRLWTAGECGCSGGFWLGSDVACLPDPCPGGACCLTSGSCTILGVDECSAAGGRFLGDAAPCEPTTCEISPAIPMSWGRLKRAFR